MIMIQNQRVDWWVGVWEAGLGGVVTSEVEKLTSTRFV